MARNHDNVGPYSRRLSRGMAATIADGRSATGRFCRALERELIAHCGGKPSIAQRLLIDRVIRLQLQLDSLDQKLAAGDAWTPHDARTFGGLQNALRLCLRELGLKSAADRPLSAAEALAAIHRGAQAAA